VADDGGGHCCPDIRQQVHRGVNKRVGGRLQVARLRWLTGQVQRAAVQHMQGHLDQQQPQQQQQQHGTQQGLSARMTVS